MRTRRLALLALLVIATLPLPASAQSTTGSTFDEIDAALRDGSPLRALRLVRRTLDDLPETVSEDEQGAATLGRLVTLRAVAESMIDDTAAALWSWALAQDLDPSVRDLDLRRYGSSGNLLRDTEERPLAEDGDFADDESRRINNIFRADGEVVLPDRRRGREPRYRRSADPTPVILQVLIDRRGRPSNPRVVDAPSALRLFLAAQAVSEWRFQPARLNRDEVAIYYNIRVDFDTD
ncbi:MAG: energy transducer TonB [Acidobacteriota bacterium]